jgi:hypothetical protein
MTSLEYDRTRLDALPAAAEKLRAIRLQLTNNDAAWTLIDHARRRVDEQLAREFKAYFAEEEERETPAPRLWPAVLKSSLLKASAEAQGIPCLDLPAAPEPDAADLPGLDSLLGAVRTEARATLAANGFSPADYPARLLLDEINGHTHRCPACRQLFNCQCNGPAKSDPYALCAACQKARRS